MLVVYANSSAKPGQRASRTLLEAENRHRVRRLLFFENRPTSLKAAVNCMGLHRLHSFALDAVSDRFEYVIHSSHRSEPWFATFPEHTSTDKDGIPGILTQRRIVELVRTPNV